MRYLKLYEKFEDDFEEVWEEEPKEILEDSTFVYYGYEDNILLIVKCINKNKFMLYKNYYYTESVNKENSITYKLHKIDNNKIINSILNNELSFYMFENPQWSLIYFKDLDKNIQESILERYKN